MIRAVIVFLNMFILPISALASGDLAKKAMDAGLVPIPKGRAAQMKVVGNPDEKLVNLGKLLYFEPRLSKSGLISCNSCHNLATGGVDGVSAAIGHKWTANPHHLNSPTVYNSVFNGMQMWDGRFRDLEEQAMGPIQAGPEMASSRDLVLQRLSSIPAYVHDFKKAFPGEKEPITFENVGKAIAAFERTMVTPSRLDDFLNGDAGALTEVEKRGLEIFIEKGCSACHNGMGIGGAFMQKFPVVRPYKFADLGDFKGNRDGLVKIPLLRNITQTAPYFHNGAVWSLADAVRTMGETQLGIDLTENEVRDIVSFLGSLEGRKPVVVYPVLPTSTGATPRPDIE